MKLQRGRGYSDRGFTEPTDFNLIFRQPDLSFGMQTYLFPHDYSVYLRIIIVMYLKYIFM